MRTLKQFLPVLAVFGLSASLTAHAQWVMVARAVSGQVQRMHDKSANGTGYDVATVVLMADADKVYQTALKSVQSHPELTITENDAKKREIKFSKGDRVASLHAAVLGEKITQLVVASNLSATEPYATSMVVEGVMKVCKQMNIVCTQSDQ